MGAKKATEIIPQNIHAWYTDVVHTGALLFVGADPFSGTAPSGAFSFAKKKRASRKPAQNLYLIPHCFRISFAVCRDLIFESTVTCLPFNGLSQIS